MRERIVEATLGIVLEVGEADASLSRVADRAGTTKPNVVHHFGSRDGLLRAVHQRLMDELDAGLARLREDFPDERDRLEAFVDALFQEPADATPEEARRIAAFHLAREPARQLRLRAFLDDLFREGARAGAWRPVRRPRHVMDVLLAAAHGAQVQWAASDEVDTERVGQWVLDMLIRTEVYGEPPSAPQWRRRGRRRLSL